MLAAFGRFVLVPRGLLAEQDPEAAEHLAALTQMITASPALLEREQQIFERYTASLAALIAEETAAEPDDIEPWVTARALIGVHRTLLDRTRRNVLAGRRGASLAAEIDPRLSVRSRSWSAGWVTTRSSRDPDPSKQP